MRLRNGESPGMGNHHEIPRSSGCRLRHPDTKKKWHLHCSTADQMECIACTLTFRLVGVCRLHDSTRPVACDSDCVYVQ